jgi:RNA polymerase sigma factor (sigma-70 family)
MSEPIQRQHSLESGPGLDQARSDQLPPITRSIELVADYQGGRASALEELIGRYLPRLRRVVRVRLGADLAGHVEVEDIVQETLIVALERFEDLEVRAHTAILSWLSKIAEHRILDKVGYFSAQKRDVRRVVPVDPKTGSRESFEAGPVLFAGIESPSQVVSRREFEQLIDVHIGALEPHIYRDILLQRDYEEASWEELRENFDRPTIAAVQELYRRAQVKLRRSLARYTGAAD